MKVILIVLFLSNLLIAKNYEITPETTARLKNICKSINFADKIIFGGGIYTKPFPIITCSGSKKSDLVIKAKDGEKVIIRQNWRVRANYLTIEGLSFVGNNNSLNYQKVIKQWWHPTSEIKKIGLLIEGHHITLKNNAIGNYPSSGVKFKGNSDYITVDHNIIYNNAWWSTGGTGGLIVKNIHQLDNSKTTKVKIINNLFFANESRIFSHVFKKGFSKLVIDEGESFLIQQKDDPRKKGAKSGKYEGRYLVKNNLILFNGKGTSLNKADNIDFIANTLYCNGTTAKSKKAAGIRANHSNHDNFIDNAIQTCDGGKSFSVKGRDNHFKNNKTDKNLFRNPGHLDFYNLYFKDRANLLYKSFKPFLEKFNIIVKPTNYKVDTKKQIEDIISIIPKKADTKIINKKKRIIIQNIDNSNLKNMGKDFILKVPKL